MAMVDYYSMLARAVAAIPRSMPGAREALYERARNILAADHEKIPQPTDAEFAAEKRVLEEAIIRIELEIASESAATPFGSIMNMSESKEIKSSIQSPSTQVEPAKRPTLSELLRRVDDAMKESAPLPASQNAEHVEPPPARAWSTSRIVSPNAEEKAEFNASRIGTPAARIQFKRQTPIPPLFRSTISGSPPERERSAPMQTDLIKVLRNFQLHSPGMEASALISRSGRMIASVMTPEMEEARIAGVTATLLNLSVRAATELSCGEVREVVVRADHGYVVMVGAGQYFLLLALANDTSQLGYIFFGMQETIKAFQNLL